jgi:hypothetical protein
VKIQKENGRGADAGRRHQCSLGKQIFSFRAYLPLLARAL